MADFCVQCAVDLYGEGILNDDLANLVSAEDSAKGYMATALCEGCGPIQVDHTGQCCSFDCLKDGHDMTMFLLVTSKMQPTPESVKVVQDYGRECIHTDDGQLIEGTSMMVRGTRKSFIEWLQPFDGVWKTNNPMLGGWNVVHIKPELRF